MTTLARFLISAVALLSVTTAAARVVYCSSSYGDDNNPGTMAAPVRTIAQAARLGDDIRLRKGDTFYESVNVKGKKIKAYGKGNRPIICGLKIPTYPNAWQQGRISGGSWIPDTTGYIWMINLAYDNNRYSGYATHGSNVHNNIGAIIDLDNPDERQSLRCRHLSDLSQDFDYWQEYDSETSRENAAASFDRLYIYSVSDPNTMHLGLTAGTIGVTISDGSISDIDIIYWGSHGIAASSNSTIQSCHISRCGGMVQRGAATWCCLGNGIEVWCSGDVHDILVKRCEISHCYDCGLTVQGIYPSSTTIVRDITFEQNTVHNCCQGWEDFFRGKDSLYETAVEFKNCRVKNNKFYDNGFNTGFRYNDNRFKYCQVLGNSHFPTGMIIEGNTFTGGNFRCCSKTTDGIYNPQIFNNNTVYIAPGQFLIGNYNGSADVIRIPDNPTQSQFTEIIMRYQALTGDYSTKFRLRSDLNNQ